MKAYELLRLLSSSELDALVWDACQDDDLPDKLAGGVITYQKLPLARFERLTEEVRKAYVRKTLRDKRASDLALFVLSSGLTHGKSKLIETFLEATGLPHEGANLNFEGAIPQPAPEVLGAAVDKLLAEFPARDAAVYLHAFSGQPDVSWPLLDERIGADEKLRLADRSGE